jgi:hypothetical protein
MVWAHFTPLSSYFHPLLHLHIIFLQLNRNGESTHHSVLGRHERSHEHVTSWSCWLNCVVKVYRCFTSISLWHDRRYYRWVSEVRRYYLTDDIYPFWSMFVKCVLVPQQEKHRFFLMKQTSMSKDVKCAFDLLKKRFNILVIYNWSYSQRTLNFIMCVCIILHNMISIFFSIYYIISIFKFYVSFQNFKSNKVRLFS